MCTPAIGACFQNKSFSRTGLCAYASPWPFNGAFCAGPREALPSRGRDLIRRGWYEAQFRTHKKTVEVWRQTELSCVPANMIIYEAVIESDLEVAKQSPGAFTISTLIQRYDEFRPYSVEPLQHLHLVVRGARANTPVQSDRKAQPVSGRAPFTKVRRCTVASADGDNSSELLARLRY